MVERLVARRKALIAKSASKFGAPGVVRGRHGQSAGDVRWGREDKKSGNGARGIAEADLGRQRAPRGSVLRGRRQRRRGAPAASTCVLPCNDAALWLPVSDLVLGDKVGRT